jgi:hypothetical protein
MPTYSKKTWATEEVATSTGLNTMSDNIELCLRSKTSDRGFAVGKKTFTFGGASDEASTTVNFSSDSDGGNPSFNAIPYIMLTPVYKSGENVSCTVWASSVGTATFTMHIKFIGGAPASGTTFDVHFLAIATVN